MGAASEQWLWWVGLLLLVALGSLVFARMAQGLLSLAIQIIHQSYKTVSQHTTPLCRCSRLEVCANDDVQVSKVPPLVARFRKQIDRKLPKNLQQLPTWERVSSRTIRISGLNPGPHTLQVQRAISLLALWSLCVGISDLLCFCCRGRTPT